MRLSHVLSMYKYTIDNRRDENTFGSEPFLCKSVISFRQSDDIVLNRKIETESRNSFNSLDVFTTDLADVF